MVQKSATQQKVGASGFTKEEELLLNDFSRSTSTKSSAIFYANAFIVSALPIWLYWRIHSMDLISSAIFFVALTAVSTYFMAMAYKNTKFSLKFKIANKREDAVTREVLRALADDKKMSKKEKDERVLWKKNEVADYESTTFAIFYNNALYLAIIIFLSFFLFKNSAPAINYIFSVGISSGLLALLSTGTNHKN